MLPRLAFVSCCLCSTLFGQELGERARLLGERESSRYEITLESGKEPANLRKLQQWSNPISSAYGVLFCWLSENRPTAIGSIYMYPKEEDKLNAELQSLSTQSFSAKRDGAVIWQPETAGVVFKTIKDIVPSTSKAQQNLEMRRIARRFSAVRKSLEDGAPRSLRLLPRPLLSYGPDDQSFFGGLFSFVVGTDPDLLLLIETATEDDQKVWRYALARLCIQEIEVQLDGKPVWSVPEHKHPFLRLNEPYSIVQAISVGKP
jgi:hypothetical protein